MANYLVDTLTDDVSNGGNLAAETADGGGLSLREALALANASGVADSISFLAALAGGTLTLTNGELVISSDVIVNGDTNGDDAPDITVSGDADSSGTHTLADSRVFKLTSGTSTLDSLVITAGYALGPDNDGGGVSIASGANVTIANSIVSNNTALDTTLYTGYGGGIHNAGIVTVTTSILSGNKAFRGGGGIHNVGEATVADSVLFENVASAGGGIQNVLSGAALTVTNTSISRNHAIGGVGGGIFNSEGSIYVTNSTLSDNDSKLAGGGLFSSAYGSATLINSTLSGNSTARHGGAIVNNHSVLTVINSTLSGNYAVYDGGGISTQSGFATLINSVVAGNGTGALYNDISGSGVSTYSGVNVFSQPGAGDAQDIIETNLANIFGAVGANPSTGVTAGVLADNGGPVETIAIKLGGVAHNTGDNAALPPDGQDLDGDSNTAEPLPVDARGETRVDGANVDVGAFEIQSQPTPRALIVTTLADETYSGGDIVAEETDGSGLSLREALALANADPDNNDITFLASLAGGTLTLVNGQLLASTDLSVDGDINGDDSGDITISGNNTTRVFNVSAGDVKLNGLVLVEGNATSPFPNNAGGAVHVANGAEVTISNVRMDGNTAQFGGAMDNLGTALLIGVTLANNTALEVGGGIVNTGELTLINTELFTNNAGYFGGGIASVGTLDLTNSLLVGNQTGDGGAGIANGGILALTDTTITQGHALRGGGIFNAALGTVTSTGSSISDNVATLLGGGIANEGSLTLTGTTLADNLADTRGAGIHNSGTATVNNSTITANTVGGSGGGIYNLGVVTVTNATISGNYAGNRGGGIGNGGGGDATLINSTLSGNRAVFGGGIYSDAATKLINSIVAGNAATATGDDISNLGTATYSGINIFSQVGAGDAEDIVETNLSNIFASVGANPFTGVNSGVLANNGGPVETIAIKTNGAAHDTGDNAALPPDNQDLDGDSNTAEPLPVDARGQQRVFNGSVDVGAFELQEASNQPPEIIGGDTAAASVAENTTAVTDIDATDPDGDTEGAGLTYSIVLPGSGGAADGALFAIDTNNGALSFIAAPDYEAPQDAGSDNVYNVTVRVTDSAGSNDDQTVTVTVTDVAGAVTTGTGGANTITGSDEADTIAAGGGADNVNAGGGDDFINGDAGADTLNGGDGNDTVNGGDGADSVLGGEGNNSLNGGSGADTIAAGSGNDTINGGDGADSIDGGAGDNVVTGGAGADTLVTGAGHDTLEGGDGADSIVGGDGVNSLDGGAGADTMISGAGEDSLDGGDGADSIVAGGGSDLVAGGAGADTLAGGTGADTLTGGGGKDTFVFLDGESTPGERDVITDFVHGGAQTDLLDLSALGFASGFGGNSPAPAAETVTWFFDGTNTIVRGNTDADADIEFELQLNGNHPLTAAHFDLTP